MQLFLNRLRQLRERERFWQKYRIWNARAVIIKRLLRVARHKDRLDRRPVLKRQFDPRWAIHSRHHHIGNEQIDVQIFVR